MKEIEEVHGFRSKKALLDILALALQQTTLEMLPSRWKYKQDWNLVSVPDAIFCNECRFTKFAN